VADWGSNITHKDERRMYAVGADYLRHVDATTLVATDVVFKHGGAGAVSPILVWTGTEWVPRPLLRWNGSAWVPN